MKSPRILVIVVLLAVAAAILVFRNNEDPPVDPDAGSPGVSATNPSSDDPSRATKTDRSPAEEEAAMMKVAQTRLDDAIAALSGADNPETSSAVLKDLHDYLGSLPSGVAAAAISAFLEDPGRDADTQLGFKVGQGGFLDKQPSLRVALLDWLLQIDPQQAGVMAERLLATPTHADEWAVCLRNFARANPSNDSHDFLRQKTEEMISNPVWAKDPSVGFLESFDVLVHTGATESSPLLGDLVAVRTPEGKALAHASYLTLDRLVIREPVLMMQQLAAQPEVIKERGQMVANMFARADLREAEQRDLVRAYLLDPTRTQQELRAFAGVYPNNNYAISTNLLTGNTTAQGADLATHDRAALVLVTQWLNDPEFESVKPHIQTMHRRLTTFVGQAGN